jgi:hypothetical protein
LRLMAGTPVSGYNRRLGRHGGRGSSDRIRSVDRLDRLKILFLEMTYECDGLSEGGDQIDFDAV